MPHANRIRIIGGTMRGQVLRFPSAPDLRPTPDRVRETLFNWLGQELTGRRCLDLYAGSGALSIEAASRGASLCVAVDTSRSLVDALRANAQRIGVAALETRVADARTYLAREARTFDIVFLDPPFREDPWPWLLPACAMRVAPGGFVYAEAGATLPPPPGLLPWRSDKAGQVHYHLFVRPAAPAPT
jgi:16S rRNA (guanine966-N2)-methyltransferase